MIVDGKEITPSIHNYKTEELFISIREAISDSCNIKKSEDYKFLMENLKGSSYVYNGKMDINRLANDIYFSCDTYGAIYKNKYEMIAVYIHSYKKSVINKEAQAQRLGSKTVRLSGGGGYGGTGGISYSGYPNVTYTTSTTSTTATGGGFY